MDCPASPKGANQNDLATRLDTLLMIINMNANVAHKSEPTLDTALHINLYDTNEGSHLSRFSEF